MKKQVIFFLFALLPILASAVENVQIGCFYYNLNSETKEAEVTDCNMGNNMGNIVIPSSITYNGIEYNVTRIGDKSLDNIYGFVSIRVSVTIPNSVTSIGDYAFAQNPEIISITIPNSVTSIGQYAFENCTNLSSITIPNSVTHIGNGAFNNTLWFNNQPEGFVYAGKVFCRYKGTLPDNSNVVLEEGTLCIADGAFRECSGISSITIPGSVKRIGAYAFAYCGNLTSSIIQEGVECIGHSAFLNCNNLISVSIPNSVTEMGNEAFQNCSSLTSIMISEKVVSIENATYDGCSSLTSIVIPKSTQSIGMYSFRNCSSLSSIIIPEGVTSIGREAFAGCTSLKTVKSYIEEPFNIIGLFSDETYRQGILYVPEETKDLYTRFDGWREFLKIQEFKYGDAETMTTPIRTLCSDHDLDFTNVPNLKAYIASGFSPSTGEIVMTRVYHVPAGEGLVLKGELGDYEIPYKNTDMYYSNLLKGVTETTTINPTEGNFTNFILANDDTNGIGFYPLSTSGNIAAGKAYLQLPTAVSGARRVRLLFDDEDEVTGIRSIENGEWRIENFFNLSGQRIARPTKGIYVKNGKKMLVK